MRYELIDIFRGTQSISYYKRLCSKEYTADELRKLQRQNLTKFLLLLRRRNGFYSEILQNIDESRIRLSPERILRSLPLVDKPFITQKMDRLFSPIQGRRYKKKHTGGSTGQPFHYYIDLEAISESWAYMLWCWHKYTGYTPGEPYLTVAGSSLDAQSQGFKTKIYRALQNNYVIRGDVISVDMQVNAKRIRRSVLVYGYPSVIITLLEMHPYFFENHQLRAVFTTSEQLVPNMRRYLEDALKIPIHDMYGANDGGLISCECEAHCGFHYDSLNCYVEEYINEEGASELLLTSLNSLTLPFVRYRVGDLATLGEFGSCPCGNPFPMIQKLHGRSRDLIRLKNGQAIHGVLFNTLLYSFKEVRRYRIIQTEDYRVSIQLDVEDFQWWYTSERKNDLEHKFSELLVDTPFVIEEFRLDALGRMKFKLIESHVC